MKCKYVHSYYIHSYITSDFVYAYTYVCVANRTHQPSKKILQNNKKCYYLATVLEGVSYVHTYGTAQMQCHILM